MFKVYYFNLIDEKDETCVKKFLIIEKKERIDLAERFAIESKLMRLC
jgi:hypothetical protein